ncbi:MAG: 50S ribosomal protein L21 [Candidatus Proteinoplasmatales archaeon SG8-5]|nr:MAG: 50S ribosomal protein L21 [Candidatus Proteinoplasmatales archaeon SG8-5]
MAQRSKGIRSRSRKIMRKSPRDRGMAPITHSFTEYEEGEKASIVIDPSVHGGQPHHRFQGLTGEVVGRQGRAFVLEVNVGKMKKRVIARPEHLKKCSK